MAHPDKGRNASFANSGFWRVLAWVGVALQVLAAVAALWLDHLDGIGIILGFLAGSVVLLLAARRLPSLLAFAAILAAVVNAGGWAWEWYQAVPWFDELVHTYSPLAIAAVSMFWFWRAGWVTARPGSGSWIILAAGYGLVLGVAWEILESFFLDLRVWDTASDLVLDTLGASIGGWLSGWVIRQQGTPAGHPDWDPHQFRL